MGLDMYIYKAASKPQSEIDFPIDYKKDSQIFYWRKSYVMDGWMTDLYNKKGGKQSEFNRIPLLLNMDDLTELTEKVTQLKLRDGLSEEMKREYSAELEEVRSEYFEFLSLAEKEIKKGSSIYYYNSW